MGDAIGTLCALAPARRWRRSSAAAGGLLVPAGWGGVQAGGLKKV